MENIKLPAAYFRLMGCFTWFVTLMLLIIIVICMIRVISNDQGALCVIGDICLFLVTAILGSAIGLLFFQVASLVTLL